MYQVFQYLKQHRKWAILLMVIAAINAVINIGVIVSEKLAHHQEVEWTFYIINEFTGSYILILFVPLLVWVFQRWPLQPPRLIAKIGWYLLVSLVFGFAYTTLMYSTRVPLYYLANITDLKDIFNDLPYRYLMEYFKQFFTFWLIYIVYWAFTQYRANRNREIREVQLQEALVKSQVQNLQMQLHPHFLFNTLNTISSVMYQDPARADRLISRLSNLLRSVLQVQDRPLHTLAQEIELLRQFTEVMLERYPEKLSVCYHIPQDCLSLQIPVLLLQPMVENAIQYAIDFKPATEVAIRASRAKERLQLEITDNGPGLAEENPSVGIGLSATIQRLKKLYGDDYHLSLANQASGGLTVSLSIPQSIQL